MPADPDKQALEELARLPSEAELPQAIFDCLARCPDYVDFPTAWAIQHSHGDKLTHHPRCSSVPGWDPISGPALLCDCPAIPDEWKRIKGMDRARTEQENSHAGGAA